MSNTPARVPYARLPISKLDDVGAELARIQRQQAGMFQPTILTHARSPYTLLATDWLILADCTAGAITITLPLAARMDGAHVTIVKVDASANTVTLSGTVNGVVNPGLSTQYTSRVLDAGNGVWYFTSKFPIPAADVRPGTFPTGAYTMPGSLTVDGGITVNANSAIIGALVGLTGLTLASGLVDLSAASAGQIQFPATQNPSANANTLDDYEEGIWTPTIKGSTADPTSIVYDNTSTGGTYTKIGNRVLIQFGLRTISFTGGTGSVLIGALPFPVRLVTNHNAGYGNLTAGDYFMTLPANRYGLTLEPFNTTSYEMLANGNADAALVTFTEWTGASPHTVYCSGQYETTT